MHWLPQHGASSRVSGQHATSLQTHPSIQGVLYMQAELLPPSVLLLGHDVGANVKPKLSLLDVVHLGNRILSI